MTLDSAGRIAGAVVFEKAEAGGYIARVPTLPGCMTQGNTLEEAEAMVKDAIRTYYKEVVESISVRVPA